MPHPPPTRSPGKNAPPFYTRVLGSFSHTPRTLGLVWRSSKSGLAMVAALVVVSAVLPVAVAWVGKIIVDAVVAAHGSTGEAHAAAVAKVWHWVLVECALVAGIGLVERSVGLVRQLLGSRMAIDLAVMIMEKALTLDLRHFEDPPFYDKLTRARREASSRPLSLVQQNFQIVRSVLTLAGYAALLVSFSPWVVVGLLLAGVPAFVAEARFSGAAYRLRNWRSPDARRLSYLEYVVGNDEHAKEVKLFGLGPLLVGRYRKFAETFFKEDRKLAVSRAGWTFALSLISTGAFYACYVIIALGAAAGRVSLGEMTLYVVAFRQGQGAFQAILTALGGMYEDNLYMANLFEFLEIPTGRGAEDGERKTEDGGRRTEDGERRTEDGERRTEDGERRTEDGVRRTENGGPRTENGGTNVEEVEKGIRFEGVGFRYPGAKEWALRGVSVFIPEGQSLALVGQNGAGKTTFIKLLTRLYAPTEGCVLLDGRDLADWDEVALRRRVGVIFQDFNQYQFALRENVGFGSVEHLADDGRIGRAVERGGANELVASLTAGLETQMGRWFNDGAELSGGQWQRVGLARAFMREEADILVLDEPTAALDAEAEHAIFERFRTLTRGRTAILISHRFPTVRMADRIVVIEGGTIREEGTHAALLAAGGIYARLFSLQAEGYR